MSKDISIFDVNRAPSLWPVPINRGGHTEHIFAVTLPYVTPKTILEHDFRAFTQQKEDPFPRSNFAGSEGSRTVVSETHTMESLARLRKTNHPQDAYLARAQAVLLIGIQQVSEQARRYAEMSEPKKKDAPELARA